MITEADIQHVIVLMLENRSFDNVLGALYDNRPDFEGLPEDAANTYLATAYPAWDSDGDMLDETAASMPNVDPGESFSDMGEQIGGHQGFIYGTATMAGFVSNFVAQRKSGNQDKFNPCEIMHYFNPAQLSVISDLAKAYGVCDTWHASAPCQTWPNRFFTHTGTCLGYINNKEFPIPFPAHSIFARLSEHQRSWRVYFHDLPQSILLHDVWPYASSNYHFIEQFLIDAHNDALPNYSFIEPRYFPDVLHSDKPNDQHPPHNVLEGEALIAQVYNALRSSKCWERSLLIITHDEHGGCFDHVRPPNAVPPDAARNNTFKFDFSRYGVRVPAVIVSPFIPPGTIVRPPRGCAYPFDHTSILATLRELFDLGSALTARDAVAPSLLSALTLPYPSNNGPVSVTSRYDPSKQSLSKSASIAALIAQPANHMQAELVEKIAHLPMRSDLPVPVVPRAVPVTDNLSAAATYAIEHVRSFLGR